MRPDLAYALAYAKEIIVTITEGRHVRIFRNGRNQAIRIPRELELPGDEVIIRKEGGCLIIEPIKTVPLGELLAQWAPLDDDFPQIDSLPAERVDL
jgi:antitoxin VapB